MPRQSANLNALMLNSHTSHLLRSALLWQHCKLCQQMSTKTAMDNCSTRVRNLLSTINTPDKRHQLKKSSWSAPSLPASSCWVKSMKCFGLWLSW